ncbi:uroporphyrinogen-III C-methyltransferase [Vulcanibacillus modesticaldus]|uniref:Uroporphyrinogen-III C-methyltransferase n=1 Tax=Vulcanibacillus modesticaldus TaxID=337097 RepID=A0A1D2YSW2_9BACI|nr:uroporphyrinogen-III C-methyltransferase [Vulcanibacillus modesticaldus]OEF98072.1 uroporphyrinogen-III C-methyltransferase [Vulcanibacillus modesticaldus]
MSVGKVFLVGAGPGDPKLITLKGIEAIKKADVVIYDRLAHPSLLKYAKKSAKKIYVGKLPNKHTLKQDEINQLLVDKALEGSIVTRLKGGDPSVFGRVGEEAQILVKQQIPFEIIPGITSAIAVPIYAGIPITHRDFTSSLAIVTGHEDPSKNESNINWEKISTATGTIVFLMGVSNINLIREKLINNGRDPNTPVAVIQWGTTVEQRTVVGTLNNIVQEVEEAKITSPATIVIGDVVKLREQLQWFEKKPLFGKRVLVTRARSQASELSAMIEELGGEPIEFPVIKIVPPSDSTKYDLAINQLDTFDWVIFTSVNGVNSFFDKLKEKKTDIRKMSNARIAAIGPKTAKVLEEKGLIVDVLPQEFRAEGLLDSLEDQLKAGQRVLLPRADIARKVLSEKLKDKGLEVIEVDAYETKIDAENKNEIIDMFKKGKIQIITFTSSSTVKNFVEALKDESLEELLQGVKLASIGPITSKTAEKLGLQIDITAAEYTIPGLVDAIRRV